MTQMWKEIFEQPEALTTCAGSNAAVLRNIAQAFQTAGISHICIAGRGTSDHAGIYAKYVIETRLGIPVSLAASSVFTLYQAKLKYKNSLVIGISQSGKAADVLEVIRSANEQGALTVSVTNDETSPLATTAQHHLFCAAGLEQSVAATKTFTTEMYLMALLVAEISGDAPMKQLLAQVPENIRVLLKTGDDIAVKAQRYRFMNECFVLSRGINYAVAYEAALKIQETCYVRARAYATSDFHHGPYAMIEKDMPVFVYAPAGPALEDIKGMLEKLSQSEAEIVLITNVPELHAYGRTVFTIPETSDDMISPFYNAVVAQMFACQLSLSRGLNPDAPRNLNKVTITR